MTALKLAAFAALAALVGCTGPDAPVGAQESYRLVAVSAPPAPPDGWDAARITATFDWSAGRISGRGGCNQYTGRLARDGQRVTIGPTAATRMACSDPQGIMARETTYLGLLGRVAAIERDGPRLILILADGGGRLIFEPAS